MTNSNSPVYGDLLKDVYIPDICERVMYKWAGKEKAEPHRVEGWYKAIPEREKPAEDADFMERIGWDLGKEDRERRAERGDVRVIACSREEATHVSIYAVAGALVRIDRVEPTKKHVEWSAELIEETRKTWLNFYCRDAMYFGAETEKLVSTHRF